MNISRSGVLFHTESLLPLNAPIEMLMVLPGEIGHEQGATVICRGRVVRAATPSEPDARAALAATIATYELVHSQGSDPRRI